MPRINEETQRLFLAYATGTITLCDLVQEHASQTVVRPLDAKRTIIVPIASDAMKTFTKVHEASSWINSKQPKVKKVKKILVDSPLYNRRRREIIEKYAPPMVDCSNCNSPRHRSYACQYCGAE